MIQIMLLCIFCQKMSIYGRNFDKAKCIYFLIKHVKMTFFLINIMKIGKKLEKL